mgnify:CR=1 FL=1
MQFLRYTVVLLLGALSVGYLANIGVGVVEFIPDNLPVVGNLDEAAATALFIACLSYYGIDLTRFTKRNEP